MSQATEKLLHVIDGRSKIKASRPRATVPGLGFSMRHRKGRFLGVDFETRGLRMVLTGGENNAYLSSRHTPYPQGMTPRDSGFPAFLKEEAAALCGHLGDLIVWSHVASPRVELIPLKMPKIPAWELGEMITWRIRKDHAFNEDEFVLDFEIQGEVMDQGSPRIAVLACLAPRRDITRMREIFSSAGLPLTGLTVASLAYQALFHSRSRSLPESNFALLDIGDTFTRIDLYGQQKILISRVIKTGMTSMAEALSMACAETERAREPEVGASIFEAEPVQDQPEIIINFENFEQPSEEPGEAGPMETLPDDQNADLSEPSAPSLDEDTALELLLHKMAEAPPPKATCPSVTPEDVYIMIQPACERLARQVERTFDYSVRTLAQSRPEHLLLTGEMGGNKVLLGYLSADLSAHAESMDALGPDSALYTDAASSLSSYEMRGLNLAAALTRCENHGAVNLLKTFLQRQENKAVERASLAVYACAILVLLLLSVFYALEHADSKANTQALQRLDERLSAFQPQVDETMLMRLAAEIGREQTRLNKLSANLHITAILGEIARITPNNIKILHLRLEPDAENKEKKTVGMIIEALVSQDEGHLEGALAGYLFTLNRSGLFKMPVVHSQTQERRPGLGEVLNVVMHLESPQG